MSFPTIAIVSLITKFSKLYYPIQLFTLYQSIYELRKHFNKIVLGRSNRPIDIIDFVKSEKINILALSAHQQTLKTLDETLHLLQKISIRQRPYLILGGALPTYLPERFVNKYPNLPMSIIRGWGEIAFRERIKEIVKNTKNSFGKRKHIIIDGTTPQSYPFQNGIPSYKKGEFCFPRVESSRGCSHNICAFCLRPFSKTLKCWTPYDPKDIIDQIKKIVELGYHGYFEFSDEDPIGNDLQRFEHILEGIKKIKGRYPSLTFGMNLRTANIISKDEKEQLRKDHFLEIAKSAGLLAVWNGAESYSLSHLRLLGKGKDVTPEANFAAALKLKHFGIQVLQGIMPYHPLATWNQLIENAKFLNSHLNTFVKVLTLPFGFLRVQINTPYLIFVKQTEKRTGKKLLGKLDEDMLTYNCKYLDPTIGIHVSYMKKVYRSLMPTMKEERVKILSGKKKDGRRLQLLRYYGLKMFIESIEKLHKVRDDLKSFKLTQEAIIEKFKRRFKRLGVLIK